MLKKNHYWSTKQLWLSNQCQQGVTICIYLKESSVNSPLVALNLTSPKLSPCAQCIRYLFHYNILSARGKSCNNFKSNQSRPLDLHQPGHQRVNLEFHRFGFSISPPLPAGDGKKVKKTKKTYFCHLRDEREKIKTVELSAVSHSSFFACLWAKNFAFKDDIQPKCLQ